ncbi:LamG-like jellyroll fold domain-containing protein [Streptomyces bugieae]|uniref:LamG-like jellyroll fold domain-containing protein n=1 Tax=Streptomyces bugieae TaxID=3098223 RepID=A0ABU7NQ16_9ACTN|nr:LamG-like jellyroll fold domain-containing protein [Streptomyces sp. DSM 41528]
MTTDFLDILRGGLTPAYDRGMERLTVPLVPHADGTLHAAYSFRSYLDRYGRLPDSPRYLLTPRRETGEPLVVRVFFVREPGASEEHVDVDVPVGRPAGQSLAVELPGRAADIGPLLTLTRVQPLAPAPRSAADWEITALLGNLVKLLWTIGRDYEELTRRLGEVAAQRYAHSAHGASLDLIGEDLGAPRFPPRPYAWDDLTVALYHLDDRPAPQQSPTAPGGGPEVREVADAGARFGAPGHPGTNAGAHSGRTGRFSAAFEFTGPASITIDHSPDFDVGPDTPLTIEAVVRPDPAAARTGAVMAKCALLSTTGVPGWSLTVGRFRELDRNLRLSVCDGGPVKELYADRDLGDGGFHHLAGVVERLPRPAGQPSGPRPAVVRLYLDGIEVNRRRLDGLGALSNAEPVVLGLGREPPAGAAPDAPYAGLLEEVRISRTARTSFEPVTGEGDDHYRMRLELFQRWLVPTPDALRAALNEAGPIAGHEAPFDVVETAHRPVTGTLALRVLPPALTQGQSVAADGDQRVGEAEAVGTPEDEPDFDPAWLGRRDDRDGIDFGADEDNRLMQLGVAQALAALLERLDAEPPGTLRVLRAYDPTARDLHRVGRALLLDHDTLDPGKLGVHAHAAGFGWVQHTRDGLVHVAQPPGPAFAISLGAPTTVVRPGDAVPLSLDATPDRLAGAQVHWSVTRCGPGDATVDQGARPVLHLKAAGDVTIQAEVTRAGHTRGCSQVVRVGLPADGLGIGASVDRAGTPGVTEEAAAGPRTDDFDESYLLVRTDDLTSGARVDYGTDPANRRMQHVTSLALDALLTRQGPDGTLSVAGAYDPGRAGLRAQGRALVLRHSVLSAGELSARAFDAGFDFVKVAQDDPPTAGAAPHVEVAVAAGEQIGVRGPSEIAAGESATVMAEPHPAPAAACFTPDGGRVHLSLPGNHRIASFTVAAGTPGGFPGLTLDASAPVAPFPGALSFAGGRLHVAHGPSDAVSVLDPATLAPAAPAITGPRPVDLGTDGSRLFVAYAGDRTLRAYDLQTHQQADLLTLPGVPRALAVSPNSPLLAVLLDDGRFCQVRRAGLQLQGNAVGTGPHTDALAAAFLPDGTKLYVAGVRQESGGGTGFVHVYPSGATAPSATIEGFPETTRPRTLCAGPDGGHLYVATAGSDAVAGRVQVIDTHADRLLPSAFTPGGDCRALAVSPAAAPYLPCVLAAPEEAASVLLADPAPLAQSPPLPPQLVARRILGPGGGQELSWSVTSSGHGRAEVSSPVNPVNRIRGQAPGVVLVRGGYLSPGGPTPYQCEVRLRQELDDAGVELGKERYDLVLNILNWFHPIGVEFRTERLRAHVRELSGTTADADLLPAYTFPTYHRADQLRSRRIRPDKDDER